MAEREFHHECRAAGLTFKTFDEWSEWLTAHKYDITSPIAEHEGFKYNVNDVCVNPHVKSYKIETNWEWQVKTAKTPDGWIWGYNISTNTSGSAAPASYPRRDDDKAAFFNTEDEASMDALNYIIRQLEGRKPKTKNINLLVWAAKKARLEIKHPQLELFT